ncbi:MAG: FkbM family methyltransferase [Planctomycetota bacterium]
MKPSPPLTRAAKRLLYRAWHLPRAVHSVTSSCCGLRFRFPSNSHIGEELYANAFERLQREALCHLVKPGTTVIDVGANLGFYTCLLADWVGPEGRVIAAEPTPRVYEQMVSNVALNGLADRVTPIQAALAEAPGTATMNVYPPGAEVYNTIGKPHAFVSQLEPEAVEVPTTTLDALLYESPADADCFIKIDVEGFQHSVLLGGAERLKAMPNVTLMVEISDEFTEQSGVSPRETFALMRSLGYSALAPLEGGRLSPVTPDGEPPERFSGDAFFVKQPPAGVLANSCAA